MKKKDHFNNNDSLEQEIEQRIETMESSSYDFGPPINKHDVIAVFIIAFICIVGMIWGFV